jgi:hypothetical protein
VGRRPGGEHAEDEHRRDDDEDRREDPSTARGRDPDEHERQCADSGAADPWSDGVIPG